MRDIKIVEKEILEIKKVLERTDESDLLKLEVNKSKLERLENELELIKRGSRKITKIEGLPKGKFKRINQAKIISNRFNI